MDSIGSIDGPTHLKVVQENERLKEEIERLRDGWERCSAICDKVKKENERLKDVLAESSRRF